MKISESWLREWVNPSQDTAHLVHNLTMAGLEVDAVEGVAGEFSGVVVGEIMAVEQHPDADKLRVCQVSDGEQTLQIVCGAPNARVGLKAPLAKVGALLPENFKIKPAKLRGVESQGMLCACEELGVSGDSSGLWELPADSAVGTDLREVMMLDDRIIEVDLTPNRGDCLSIRGVAREVGVIYRQEVCEPEVDAVPAAIGDAVAVYLEAAQACPTYLSRVIEGVDVSASTPDWMVEKLERSDLRSIDPIVDVTNFVLMELGQPMHAFDRQLIGSEIHVRMANAGEKLELLDEQEVELAEDVLVIADKSQALAMAGIMGGKKSGVSESTTSILLESAFFHPLAIAGRSRRFGLHTDSSHRFERGVDPQLQRKAMERATELILSIAGGRPGPVVEAHVPEASPENPSIKLSLNRLQSLIGCQFEPSEVDEILRRLGLNVIDSDGTNWTVVAPSWRFDLEIEADLIEEIIRIQGYDKLPEKSLSGQFVMPQKTETRTPVSAIRNLLVSRDYQEIVSYSFIDGEVQKLFDQDSEAVPVLNPISSDMDQMRLSLLPGLVSTLKRNLNRQHNRVRLFEVGQCFIPDRKTDAGSLTERLDQPAKIGGLIYGTKAPEQWGQPAVKVDFFDAKADVEALLGLSLNSATLFQAAESSVYHPGQCATVILDGEQIGFVGALHPRIQSAMEIPQPVYLFELDLERLTKNNVPQFRELSRFPATRRDLAIVIDHGVPVQSIQDAVSEAAGGHLHNIKVFDIYQGQGIENTEKSVAIGLTFMDSSRTLVESEINQTVDSIVERLRQKFDARLRD